MWKHRGAPGSLARIMLTPRIIEGHAFVFGVEWSALCLKGNTKALKEASERLRFIEAPAQAGPHSCV